jgi:hypothetical protein
MATRQDQILRFGVEVASDPGLLKVATIWKRSPRPAVKLRPQLRHCSISSAN